MKGLLRKDFYLLWNYCRLFIILVLGFLVLSAFAGSGDNAFLVYYPCILGSAMSINLLAYDEAEHWCAYCDTLPVTRRQFVTGKYLMSLICAGIVFLLSAAASAFRLSLNGGFDGADFVDQLAVLATISPLPAALCLPLMFKYGTQKGRIAFFVVIGVFCASTVFLDVPDLTGVSLPMILLPLMSLAIFAASWLLSVRFYQKREI